MIALNSFYAAHRAAPALIAISGFVLFAFCFLPFVLLLQVVAQRERLVIVKFHKLKLKGAVAKPHPKPLQTMSGIPVVDKVVELAVSFFGCSFPYSGEVLAFFMALEAAVAVRTADDKKRGPKGKRYNWFLNFAKVTLIGFGGAWFAPMLLGSPSAMLVNADVNVTLCFVAYWLAFHFPGDVFWKVNSTVPCKVLYTAVANLFRAQGIAMYCDKTARMFPSTAYYGTPLMGPILSATLLGNVGLLYRLGYEKHFEGGMPFQFQNGLWCGSFYHIYTNDQHALGSLLRELVGFVPAFTIFKGFFRDDRHFAAVAISAFMAVVAVLRLPDFLGASWSPFSLVGNFFTKVSMMNERNSGSSSNSSTAATQTKKLTDEQPRRSSRRRNAGKED